MITTHVLDLSSGKPAGGVRVTLTRIHGEQRTPIGDGVTDADGRQRDLSSRHPVTTGVYELQFETGPYFRARGVEPFHPRAVIVFEITDAAQHYHVPLLVSPFGYTTYRGS